MASVFFMTSLGTPWRALSALIDRALAYDVAHLEMRARRWRIVDEQHPGGQAVGDPVDPVALAHEIATGRRWKDARDHAGFSRSDVALLRGAR